MNGHHFSLFLAVKDVVGRPTYVTFGDEKSYINEHVSPQTCYPCDYFSKIPMPNFG